MPWFYVSINLFDGRSYCQHISGWCCFLDMSFRKFAQCRQHIGEPLLFWSYSEYFWFNFQIVQEFVQIIPRICKNLSDSSWHPILKLETALANFWLVQNNKSAGEKFDKISGLININQRQTRIKYKIDGVSEKWARLSNHGKSTPIVILSLYVRFLTYNYLSFDLLHTSYLCIGRLDIYISGQVRTSLPQNLTNTPQSATCSSNITPRGPNIPSNGPTIPSGDMWYTVCTKSE
jgi:hypothetical protein